MGLSTKQVSSDGLDWSQTFQPKSPAPAAARRQPPQNGLQPPPEQLKCPRCESTNTKFCYYNNYNKTQPRHFCRACKRHWTKGGTLRNVPVGGGRKNKRLRKSTNTPASAATTTAANYHQLGIDQDQKIISQANFYPRHNLDNNNNIIFSSSLPFVHQSGSISFPFSSSISANTNSSSFDTNLSSISTPLQSSNAYNYAEDQFKSSMEEATITSIMPNVPQPVWKSPAASAAEDVYSNDWNWEDIETLVSADINLPWENNPDVKP